MTSEEFKEEAERIRPEIVSVAMKYMCDADEAEDAAQDVLLKMWQIHDSLRLPLFPLARVLVRNSCIDRLRRKRPKACLDDRMASPSEEEDDRMERMMKIIDGLPTLQQTVLRLRHMEGMEMRDIANLVGSTETAVRKTLSRARMAVRETFIKQMKR